MNKVIPVGTKVFVFSYDGGPSDDLKDYEFEMGVVIDSPKMDNLGVPLYTVLCDDGGEIIASNNFLSNRIGFIRTFEQYINYLSLKIANNYQTIKDINKKNEDIYNFIKVLIQQNCSEKNTFNCEYVPSNDSVKIAEKLSEFSCDLSKTEEVIKKYQDLIKKDVSSSKVLRNKNNRN